MNVVFDLGGVLINWDPRNLYRKVFDAPEKMEWFLANVCTNEWNLAQDGGRSFDDGVVEAIERYPDQAEMIALYRDSWSKMLGGEISGTVAILQELHAKGVSLYAITNWNGDTFRQTLPQFSFLKLFRDIVVSGDVKLLKPEAEIYELLASRNNLELADCIFIDDSLKNVKGAQEVGMLAHHFTNPENLRAQLVALQLL